MQKKKIMILFIVLLLLIGGCYMISRSPAEEDPIQEEVYLVPEDEWDQINSITITGSEGTEYTLLKDENGYAVKEMEQENTSEAAVELIFYYIIHLKTTGYVPAAEDAVTGLSAPVYTILLEGEGVPAKEILVGNTSSLLSGTFVKDVSSDKLYLVNDEVTKELDTAASSFMDMHLTDFAYETDYDYLEDIKIEGKDILTIEFKQRSGVFGMVQPIEQMCDQDYVKSEFLHAAMHLSGEIYAGNEVTADMGFDDPQFTVTMTYKDETVKILVGNLLGEYRYIKRADQDRIYMIAAENLAFLEKDYRVGIGENLYYRSIADIQSLTVEFGGKIYEIRDIGKKEGGYQGDMDGKTVSHKYLVPLFNSVRSLEIAKNITAPGDEEIIRITAGLKDGGKDEIVISKRSAREYGYTFNGVTNFSVSKTSVDELTERILLLDEL